MSRANFVEVRLAAAATDIQDTLSVKAPTGGLKLPPADGGRLVLTDSPGRPSAFEVIDYTGLTGTGPYTLTGVTRGVEGTVGVAWGIDTFVVQSLTVGELDSLLALKLNAASYSAADVLTKIKTVDGAGSGLDADLLDGQSGAFYQNATNLTAGTIPAARVPTLNQSTTGNAATATALQTARTINGVSFNGTANITVADTTKQPLDATLTALAGVATAADQLIYATGADTFATATLTAQARALLDDATPLGMRSTLELVKQTSAIDTTAGALMAVGAFGLGGSGVSTVSADLDLETGPTTLIGASASTLNIPLGGVAGVVLHTRWTPSSSVQATQTFFAIVAGSRIFHRHRQGGVWSAWQELWHTGNLTKQASSTDTTAGAMMTVGAFGLGTDGSTAQTRPTDCNLATVSGFYQVSGTALNRPTGAGALSGFLLVYPWESQTTIKTQEFIAVTTVTRKWARVHDGTSWRPWVETYHTGNILGTVSQSSGVPTGAIIERGSNANGNYVRYADGTQICTAAWTMDSATSFGTGTATDPYRTSVKTINWAATFSAAPAASAIPIRTGTGLARIGYVSGESISTTQLVNFQVIAVTNDVAPTVYIQAIGRWF